MTLKSEEAIATAMSKTYKGLQKERKEQILATVRAVQPDKAAELHANFTENLTEPEKHFYTDIVEGGDEVVNGKPGPDAQAVNGATPSTSSKREGHAST